MKTPPAPKTAFRSEYRGRIATRTSTHAYAFVVWATYTHEAPALLFADVVVGVPMAVRWTTRRDLAEKEANTLRMSANFRGLYSDVAVVPVTF